MVVTQATVSTEEMGPPPVVHRVAVVAAISQLEEVLEVPMLPVARGALRTIQVERVTMAETTAAGRMALVDWVAQTALDPEGPDSEAVAEAVSIRESQMAQEAAERAVPTYKLTFSSDQHPSLRPMPRTVPA